MLLNTENSEFLVNIYRRLIPEGYRGLNMSRIRINNQKAMPLVMTDCHQANFIPTG